MCTTKHPFYLFHILSLKFHSKCKTLQPRVSKLVHAGSSVDDSFIEVVTADFCPQLSHSGPLCKSEL